VIHSAPRVVGLLRAAPARAGRTRVLAIDGHSGAGKTTLAEAVRAVLEAEPDAGPVPVVHLDSIYPGWDGLADSIPRLVEWVLRPLAEGRPVRYRRYDWDRDEYAEWIDVPTDPIPSVLIVEGAGAGSLPCAPYLSLLVWMEAPVTERFDRGMARDGDTYRPHWQRWADQEAQHFAEHDPRGRADLRLDTQEHGVA
jgi:energy-coupling factor transporter ATP-binding protein EcfA2